MKLEERRRQTGKESTGLGEPCPADHCAQPSEQTGFTVKEALLHLVLYAIRIIVLCILNIVFDKIHLFISKAFFSLVYRCTALLATYCF